jgi:hypothetical protein
MPARASSDVRLIACATLSAEVWAGASKDHGAYFRLEVLKRLFQSPPNALIQGIAFGGTVDRDDSDGAPALGQQM